MLRNEEVPFPGGEDVAPRSLFPFSPGSEWLVTLVDACSYGREGLRAALELYSRSSENGAITMSRVSTLPHLPIVPGEEIGTAVRRCLAIRLPPTAQKALYLLLQLALLPAGYYTRVVVISAVNPTVIRRLLFSVGLRHQVCCADDRLGPMALCRMVTPRPGDYSDEVLPDKPCARLTPAEYRVLTQTLLGMSAREQASQAHTVMKTIYAQRASVLRKLKVRNIRTLLRQFEPAAARRTI